MGIFAFVEILAKVEFTYKYCPIVLTNRIKSRKFFNIYKLFWAALRISLHETNTCLGLIVRLGIISYCQHSFIMRNRA